MVGKMVEMWDEHMAVKMVYWWDRKWIEKLVEMKVEMMENSLVEWLVVW